MSQEVGVRFEVDEWFARDALHAGDESRKDAGSCSEAMARALGARIDMLERRNSDLETFVRALAHDSASHIRCITLRAQMLRERLNTADEDVTGMLDAIDNRAQCLAELSEGLLRLIGIDRHALERASTNLSAVAERIAFQLQSQSPQRPARFEIEPGVFGCGDAALLALVLENLLGNAWKFSAREPMTRIAFGRRREDGVYYVTDNGVGFAIEDPDALFEPFVRLSSARGFAGMGLGLSTVKRIIERHGGWIRAQSGPGQGATFTFTLPADPA